MDKKMIIVLLIIVLLVLSAGIGAMIFMAPPEVEEVATDIHTPNNVVTELGITRPDKALERLMALRTYQGQMNMDEMITDLIHIGKNGTMEYWEEDPEGNDFLLVVPFEINGTMEIRSLEFEQYEEIYKPVNIVYKANNGKPIPDNYSLLIRYSRPAKPEYEILLSQKEGDQTATYQIKDTEMIDGRIQAVGTIQYVKEDSSQGTHSAGVPIKLIREKQ